MAVTQKRTASGRVNFGKIHDVAETPDLLGIQLQSFQDFFQLETTPEFLQHFGLSSILELPPLAAPVEDEPTELLKK